MTTKQKMCAVCVYGVMGLVTLPLHAQEVAEDAQQEDKDLAAQAVAVEKMKEGMTFFNGSNYARAVEKWTESFLAYPSGFAMLNIAKAYVELERFDDARVAIDTARGNRGYLALPLDQAGLIDLQTLEQVIKTREIEAQQQKQAEKKAARIKACRDGRGRLSRLGKGGLVAVGVGGLSMLGSIPFNIKAGRQLDALTPPHTEGRDTYDQDVEALESTQRVGKIFLYSGAGVALTGLGLFAFDMTTEEYPHDECQGLLDSSREPDNGSSTTLRLGPGQFSVIVRF